MKKLAAFWRRKDGLAAVEFGIENPMRARASGSFLRCEDGASAVEFALVASALVFTIIFTLLIGLIIYYNQAVDYAASKASRQIMIGAVQKAGTGRDDFRTTFICANLPSVINCSDVIVNVQTVTQGSQPGGYYALVKSDVSGLIIPTLSNSSAQYSLGAQGSYEYLQVIYPVTIIPPFFSSMLGTATYNGSKAFLVVSTIAFRNEQY